MSTLPPPITSPLPRGFRGFFAGARALLVGLRLVLPGGGLFRYAIAPILITLVVLCFIVIGAFWVTKFWLLELFDETWISWLGGVLAVLLALLLAWFLFVPAMALFAPWCTDPICDHVHARYTGRPLVENRGAGHLMRRQAGAVVQALQAVALALLIQTPLAVLSLLTGVVGLIAIPVSAVIQGVDLVDFPLSIRHDRRQSKFQWTKRNFGPVAGLGAAASVLMLVPVLNLFVVPAGAAAATILMLTADGGEPKSTEHL